ncbi:MAG: hypothetical protein GXO65_07495 [Euryarchaeota archaeon]|nr:hypothetical protein [Euryarchaeota archaeon]
MEFCPSCKSFMVPKKVGEKTVLACSGCGHETSKFKKDSYKIITTTRREHRDIPIIESRDTGDKEEQHRYFNDLYGDVSTESEE